LVREDRTVPRARLGGETIMGKKPKVEAAETGQRHAGKANKRGSVVEEGRRRIGNGKWRTGDEG